MDGAYVDAAEAEARPLLVHVSVGWIGCVEWESDG